MSASTSTMVAVTACPICGGDSFSTLGERSDGITVLQCERCRMGFVAQRPADTSLLYSDEYYAGGRSAEVGYTGYELVAAHSLAWAVELIGLLRQEGKILDVGCADGYLLASLGGSYDCYGIEVNERLFRQGEAMGIRMIGRDICDPGLRRDFADFFDIISAIATLEHVTDMRVAVEQIRDLLTPDGVLLFETPLVSTTHDNSMWFRSSLEHIYYPTAEGLEYLFQDVFGLPVIGREVVIRGFASTFVGLATRSAEKHRQLQAWFQRLFDAPISSLDSRAERSFRFYFDLVHAASPTPENVALLSELPGAQLTGSVLHRLSDLWKTDLLRADSLRQALEQRGDATRAELHSRLATMQTALEDERSRNAQLDAGRRWLEHQFLNWQKVAEDREREITSLQDQVSSTRVDLAAFEVALGEERSRTAALETVAEQERSRMDALKAVLEERRRRLESLVTALHQRDQQLTALEASLAEREEAVAKLLASTSWKLTAPMRAVGRSLRRARRAAHLHPGVAIWQMARIGYRLLPISGRVRFRLRQAVLARLQVAEGTPPEAAVARLRDLVQKLTWQRTVKAVSLLLRGDLASLKMRMGQLAQHSFNQEVLAALTEPPAEFLVRQQEVWPASQPLISVIIPCYNYGQFIAEAVDSVVGQTFQNFEILVIDGGSSEDTLTVLRNLDRPKTHIYLREGRHLSGDNRNFGISRARGKYVCCLDADDMIRPTYLEKALFLLETQDFDLVSTSIQCTGDSSAIFHLERFPVLADMLRGNNVSTCAVFRKELWTRAGGFQDSGVGDDYFYEDWRLWVRFAALGARMANIVEEPLFLYRVHSSSLSRRTPIPSMDRQREAVRELNADVITDQAFHRSEENRRLKIRMQDGLVNLRGTSTPALSDGITILIALPFLVVGGAERLISEVISHLDTCGFRIVLVTTEYVYSIYGDSTAWFERTTSEIYHLPRFLEPSRWREFIFYLFETRNVSLLWIVGSRVFYELLPALKTAYPELKAIDLLFNTVGHTASNRKYAEYFDKILVENEEVASWLRAAGEPPERVLQIPSGVDLAAFHPRPKPDRILDELGIPPGSFIAGFSGRLAEEKDPDTFLEIAHRCRRDSQLVFLMTGAGPLSDQVRKRIERLALGDRLRFLGQVEHVKDYLATYDVLVLPSRLDGRPVAVLESLAFGVPVVASRVGALPELVQDGVTGFLCEPGDAASFAERIRWLAAHPEEHRRMKAAARAFAEVALDARQMFERYEEAIRGVLAQTPVVCEVQGGAGARLTAP